MRWGGRKATQTGYDARSGAGSTPPYSRVEVLLLDFSRTLTLVKSYLTVYVLILTHCSLFTSGMFLLAPHYGSFSILLWLAKFSKSINGFCLAIGKVSMVKLTLAQEKLAILVLSVIGGIASSNQLRYCFLGQVTFHASMAGNNFKKLDSITKLCLALWKTPMVKLVLAQKKGGMSSAVMDQWNHILPQALVLLLWNKSFNFWAS